MFDWNNYLKIAHDFLMVDPSSPEAEAYYRCGISRAYYSVYNKSEKYILTKTNTQKVIPVPPEGSHQAVIRILKNYSPIASKDLSRLRYYRTMSDYKCEAIININTFKECLNLATSIDGQI